MLGCTVAVSVGAPNWVNAGEASGVTDGPLGAEGESQAQALIAISSAIEATRSRERFMGIHRPGRTNAGQYSVTGRGSKSAGARPC